MLLTCGKIVKWGCGSVVTQCKARTPVHFSLTVEACILGRSSAMLLMAPGPLVLEQDPRGSKGKAATIEPHTGGWGMLREELENSSSHQIQDLVTIETCVDSGWVGDQVGEGWRGEYRK